MKKDRKKPPLKNGVPIPATKGKPCWLASRGRKPGSGGGLGGRAGIAGPWPSVKKREVTR